MTEFNITNNTGSPIVLTTLDDFSLAASATKDLFAAANGNFSVSDIVSNSELQTLIDSTDISVEDENSNVITNLFILDDLLATGNNKLDFISITQAVDLDTIESDTATNNAKVSFPEAPSDGKQYARKDTSWEEVTGSGGKANCCPFGAKSDSTGKFLIANGKSSDADDSSKPKTQQPIPYTGTIVALVYKTKEANSNTRMKIHVNGVVEATVNLTNINADYGGIEVVSISVTAGDYVEIEYDANQKPGECTMSLNMEIT